MRVTINELKTRFSSWKTPTETDWDNLIDTLSSNFIVEYYDVDNITGDIAVDVNNSIVLDTTHNPIIFVKYGETSVYLFNYDKPIKYGLNNYPTFLSQYVHYFEAIEGPAGPPGPPGVDGIQGPPGPTAVSTDPNNVASLGSDNLIFVPKTDVSDSVLTTDVEVIGVGTVGAVSDGDTFLQGKNLTEVLTQLVQQTIPPTYTNPSGALYIPEGSTKEVGATITYTLDPRFTQNDGGPYTEVRLFRSGTLIQTQTNLTDYKHLSQTVVNGSVQYKEEIDYSQGPIKNDNFGNPYPTGRIPAGTVTKTRNVYGAYYHWYGEFGATPPPDGAYIRSNASKTFSNTFTLNTGDTALVHVIAIPSSKNLVKVIDEDALNLDVTGNYVLSGSITSVPDAGGNNPPYKVYISVNAAAFPENHRHNVTLS